MDLGLPTDLVFHPGHLPTPVLSDRDRRRRRVLRASTSPRIRPAPRPFVAPPTASFEIPADWPTRRQWYLLPSHATPRDLIIQLSAFSVTDAWTAYANLMRTPPPKPNVALEKAVPQLKALRLKGYGSTHMLKELADTIHKNQFVRHNMLRLLAKWRASRLQEGNSVDLATMETPTVPIRLVDWANQRTYVFEARTLYKDCTSRLLHADLEFPDPKPPRNPYTNVPLTLGQLHEVTQALRRVGLSHWTLDALQRCSYDTALFALNFDTPLKHAALRRTLSNPTENDCVNLVYEFIEQEHDNHGQHFNKQLYLWALQNEANCDKIIKWRNLCRRYYTLLIECRDMTQLNHRIQTHINDETEGLCGPPSDLIAMRNTANRKALLASSSAAGAQP